jgi:hypothetical protein
LNTALSGKVPTSRTLTINGTTQDLSANRTFTISTGITIGTTPITSGTVGRVLFEGTGNVVSESANLFWDNTNGRLGIGGTPSTFRLDVNGTARIQGDLSISTGQNVLVGTTLPTRQTNSASYPAVFIAQSNSGIFGEPGTGFKGLYFNANIVRNTSLVWAHEDITKAGWISSLSYEQDSFSLLRSPATSTSAVFTNLFTVRGNGNVQIGTTTDAGFKLDVNGTARVSGQITTTTANAQFGTVGASTGNFRIDGVNGAGYAFAVYSSSTLRFGVVGYGGIDMPNGFNVVTGSTDLTTTRLRIGTGNGTAPINIQAQTGNADIVSFKASNGTDQFTIKNTSGNILVGTSTDIASSKLTVESTTQGFLPPRMTTTQKNAIATPSAGLMVYDTTLNLMALYNGTTWITL